MKKVKHWIVAGVAALAVGGTVTVVQAAGSHGSLFSTSKSTVAAVTTATPGTSHTHSHKALTKSHHASKLLHHRSSKLLHASGARKLAHHSSQLHASSKKLSVKTLHTHIKKLSARSLHTRHALHAASATSLHKSVRAAAHTSSRVAGPMPSISSPLPAPVSSASPTNTGPVSSSPIGFDPNVPAR